MNVTNSSVTHDSGSTSLSIDTKSSVIAIACAIVIALSFIGNTLVVIVILRYRRLQNATNFILLSLAIADLTVSFLVMLPSMIYDIKQKWIFSRLFCKFYNAFDITCCTASILHLLLVAVDRYVAIFKPLSYRNMVRKCHVFAMVILVWVISACLSFIPIFLGLNRSDYWSTSGVNATMNSTARNTNDTATEDTAKTCQIEANLPYAIISSSLSFYIPLILMTIVYIQIYIVARRQAIEIAKLDVQFNQPLYHNDTTTYTTQNHLVKSYSCNTIDTSETNRKLIDIKNTKQQKQRRTKDTKAIKTLGIIMGIFIICWLPFFVMYLYAAFCPSCVIKKEVERLITWIGYVNSFINPIVYAFTNRDFRKAYIAAVLTICPCIKSKKNKNKSFVYQQKRRPVPPKITVNGTNMNTTRPQERNNSIVALEQIQMCLYSFLCFFKRCRKLKNDNSRREIVRSQNKSDIDLNYLNQNDVDKDLSSHNHHQHYLSRVGSGAGEAGDDDEPMVVTPITVLNDNKRFYSLGTNMNRLDDESDEAKCFNLKKTKNANLQPTFRL